MLNKVAAFVVGTVLVVGCGSTQDDQSDVSIVGGTKVSANDAITASTVALVTSKGKSFCTGSLIGPKLVVTASHCLVDYDDKLSVAFGTVAKSGSIKPENMRAASKFFVHEDYDTDAMDEDVPTNAPNDIALIYLAEEAPRGFKPVSLLSTSDRVAEGETLTLAGFGLTHYLFGSSGTLRKVNTKIKALMPNVKELEFGENANMSACMGDSGGPAFIVRNDKLFLIGVTSRGSSKCDSTGIYTDVRYFGNWLAATR